jgi:hypothetical protein
MTKKMVTLYVVKHSHGGVEICSYKLHQMDHLDCVLMDTVEVEVEYQEIDTRQAEIDKLEAAIREERAKSHLRVEFLLDRISKLKAIGHDASAAPVAAEYVYAGSVDAMESFL